MDTVYHNGRGLFVDSYTEWSKEKYTPSFSLLVGIVSKNVQSRRVWY